MQVCLNGHKITGMMKKRPQDAKHWCPKCGAKTITQCPNRHADIPGYEHSSAPGYADKTSPPAFCHNCGKPFPRQEGVGVSAMAKDQRIYKFDEYRIILNFGDISEANTKAIVSSDNYMLSMGGGVSRALLRAGGNSIALEASKKVPARLGDVVVTSAGSLPALYIFHAVTIGTPFPEPALGVPE